jgi:hypothetical protein
MAHNHHGTKAEFRASGVGRPLEDAVKHLDRISGIEESSLTEAIGVRVAGAVHDVDQVGVFFDSCMIEVNLLEQAFSIHAGLLECAHVVESKVTTPTSMSLSWSRTLLSVSK